MAAFRIHEDYEKENPKQMTHIIKEKSIAATNGGVGGGGAGVGLNKLQQQQVQLQQGRPNFAVLNANTNANNGGWNKIINGGGGAASKTNFLNANHNNNNNNTKLNDDKAGFPHGIKKSNVVPVEQFKTFSVYEDQPDDAAATATITSSSSITQTTTASTITIDKENVFVEQRMQEKREHHVGTLVAIKSDLLTPDDEDYVLDTTPMSVSDVLSPMSVDRSHIMSSNENGHMIKDMNDDDLMAMVGGANGDVNKRAVEQQQQQTTLMDSKHLRFFDVPEYQNDILEYFRESEKKHRPKPNYMRRQSDINYSMRTILVDWLVEVSEEYNLNSETLYLSVSYIDRFLSHMSVVRSKLQLVGTAAMFIASKYEEIYPPDVSEFVFITDDTYTKAQVLRMEQIILKILAFDLCTPTALAFINAYGVVLNDVPEHVMYLAQYISELSLLDADPYLRFLPSLISSAAMALARCNAQLPMWSIELEAVTTYRAEDLKEVFLYLNKTHVSAEKLSQQAIQEKYKSPKYKSVSQLKALEIDEQRFNEMLKGFNNANNANDSMMSATNQENVRRMISRMFK